MPVLSGLGSVPKLHAPRLLEPLHRAWQTATASGLVTVALEKPCVCSHAHLQQNGVLRAVQVLPDAPADLISELSRRYILLYETITGQTFQPAPTDQSPAERMQRNVTRALECL